MRFVDLRRRRRRGRQILALLLLSSGVVHEFEAHALQAEFVHHEADVLAIVAHGQMGLHVVGETKLKAATLRLYGVDVHVFDRGEIVLEPTELPGDGLNFEHAGRRLVDVGKNGFHLDLFAGQSEQRHSDDVDGRTKFGQLNVVLGETRLK